MKRFVGHPDPKKPTILRGRVGVRNCESSDRIKGCDGTCIHAVSSLAGVGGSSITNVTAFTFAFHSIPTPLVPKMISTRVVKNASKRSLTPAIHTAFTGLHQR